MKIRNMRKQILLFVAVAFTLSSCGIYSKYKPVSEVPDGLYGSTDESAAQPILPTLAIWRGGKFFPILFCRH